MERSIKKACEDYDKKVSKSKSNEGDFFTSDFVQIKDMVLEKMGNSRSINDLLYETMNIALKAGFMIGFEAGKRGSRNRQAD